MAMIGCGNAVTEFSAEHLTGVLPCVPWAAPIFVLIGIRNRLFVSTKQALAFTTNVRLKRLIFREASRRETGTGTSPVLQPG